MFETRIMSFERDFQPLVPGPEAASRRLKAMIRKPHIFTSNAVTSAIQYYATLYAGEQKMREEYLEYANTLCETVATKSSRQDRMRLFECGPSSHFNTPSMSMSMHRPDNAGKDLNDRLAAATSLGLSDQVARLLKQIEEPSLISPLFGHPMVIAAHDGNVIILNMLLRYHEIKDLDYGERQMNWNAAVTAASAGQLDTFKLMMAPNRDLNQDYSSILAEMAAENGHGNVLLWICKFFPQSLKAGTIEQVLTAASENGHTEVVRLILTGGLGVVPSRFDCQVALEYAIHKGFAGVTKLLLECLPSEMKKPVRNAVRHGHQEVLQVLLDNGVDIGQDISTGKFARHLFLVAASSGETSMLRFLIKNGADIQDQKHCQKALEFAVRGGHEDTVRFIASLGVPLNAEGLTNANSPMLWAHMHGQQHVVQTLLALGADAVDPMTTEYADLFARGLYPLQRNP